MLLVEVHNSEHIECDASAITLSHCHTCNLLESRAKLNVFQTIALYCSALPLPLGL